MNSPAAPDPERMRALILAAGYGTRLAPVTDHLPKPLLPVHGVPLLDRIIAGVLAADVGPIAVNSHHLGTVVGDHLSGHEHAGQLVHFPETEILGTGGALANARDFLAAGPHFLVHNGDVLCGVDLRRVVAAHVVSGALATLLLVDWPAVNSVTLGRDGTVRHIGGAMAEAAARPGDRQLTYTGIGVFARELLADIEPGFSSLIDPLVRAVRTVPGSVRGYAPAGLVWDDLGTLHRWLRVAGRDVTTRDGFRLERIRGHGSDRRFWRLGRGDWSAVAMVSPPADPEFTRFVDVGRFLAEAGLGPAEFLSVDEPNRTVLMTDLGRESMHAVATAPSAKPGDLAERYGQVVDLLLRLQALTEQAFSACPLAVDRVLDLDQLRWETTYFQERFLQGHLGLPAEQLTDLEPEFADLAAYVAGLPTVLVHRDFQSQNILFQDGRVRLVDFQGLRRGPLTYDLASLIHDPYVDLPADLRQDLVARFAAGTSAAPPAEIAAMTVCAGLQRVMQALGAFGYLGHVKGKPEFLAHIPAGVRNLRGLLADLKQMQDSTAANLPGRLPVLTSLIATID